MACIDRHGIIYKRRLVSDPCFSLNYFALDEVHILAISDQFYVLVCTVCDENYGIFYDQRIIKSKRVDRYLNKNKKTILGWNLNVGNFTHRFTIEIHPIEGAFASSH